MKDTTSRTEAQAATSARNDTWPDDNRDHDLPGPVTLDDHTATCTDEDCERLLCVLNRVVAEQRAAREEQRAWDDYKWSQRDEEEAS